MPVTPDDPTPEAVASAGRFYQNQSKSDFVRSLFDRIAARYDLLNSITSLGMHHRWRTRTVSLSGLGPGDSALDIACGTGDFVVGLSRVVGHSGRVVGLDFSANMLTLASSKLAKRRVSAHLVQGDAEKLPFRSNCFDAITIGFALRNLVDIDNCFREMHRVLVPSGRVLALEISRPGWWPYRQLFLVYFEKILPALARVFGGNKQAYRWLPASLAAFHSRQGVVSRLENAGFGNIEVHNLGAGAVCIFIGHKI